MIKETVYRGINSFQFYTDMLSVTIFLEFGAKIVSIKNLKTGYEFLWQGEKKEHPIPKYGSSYIENDLCGADDMFPSINSSYYPSWPWAGIKCPCHGELWSIPWDYEIGNESIKFYTNGVRFPYSFQKIISFKNSSTLHIEYKIANLSCFDFSFIWAFHPLFNIGEDTKIILPKSIKNVINTLNLNNRLGKVGNIHKWPETVDKYGKKYDLSSIDNREKGICEKFFATKKLSEGWAMLKIKEEKIKLAFPIEKIPYLGVWINNKGMLGQENIALEPATGSLDDIYVSNMWEEKSILPNKGIYEFFLDIEII